MTLEPTPNRSKDTHRSSSGPSLLDLVLLLDPRAVRVLTRTWVLESALHACMYGSISNTQTRRPTGACIYSWPIPTIRRLSWGRVRALRFKIQVANVLLSAHPRRTAVGPKTKDYCGVLYVGGTFPYERGTLVPPRQEIAKTNHARPRRGLHKLKRHSVFFNTHFRVV